MATTRLSDLIVPASETDVRLLLESMESHFRKTYTWILENVNKEDKSIVIQNLIWSTADYLRIAANNIANDGHISVLALATRNIYELQLRTEHVLSKRSKLELWQAEVALDKTQLIKGILNLHPEDYKPEQRQILQDEIERVDNLLDKYNLQKPKRILPVGQIAKELGKEKDYKSLFKLFSKLVHPSSYLVNDYANAAAEEIRETLQIHCQLYAWSLYQLSCTALSVPEHVQKLEMLPRHSQDE